MYKDVLCEDFIEQYKSYHMTLYRELNIMLFDVAFLKECISQNGSMVDNNIIVLYLFKNTFEHLVLKTYRIIFDKGPAVLTLDKFIGEIIKNLKSEELKDNLRSEISGAFWKSTQITAVKNRLKEPLGEFRDKAIAHKLTKEMEEVSVSLEDISKLLDAAIDLFEILSFYPLDFYDHEITEYSFIAKRLNFQEQSKQLLDLLWFLSKDIRHIDVELRNGTSNSDKEKIENFISEYNSERDKNAICSKLLIGSKIKPFTQIDLLQINEFKQELLQCKQVSDAEILDIACNLRQRFADNKSKDKAVDYKLSILDTCIENIKETVGKE